MEELKLLIQMVTGLPTLTIWVLVGYLLYKLAIIGSIYGVIRFAIDKLHSWATTPKKRVVDFKFNGITINEDVALALMAQVTRLGQGGYGYVHSSDITALREAVDLVIEKRKKVPS